MVPETSYHHIVDNESVLRFAGRIPFVNATSLAYFTEDGLLQHLLHGLKYKGKKEIGSYLGRRLAGSILKNKPAEMQENWISSVDMIIPVPLHPAKLAKRGYNQSLLIAEGMADILKIPVADNILIRVKDTESQTRKSRAERVNNMADAFSLRNKGLLTNKHVLLCDDVLTTGATLEACALALLNHDSLKISLATIGIAV